MDHAPSVDVKGSIRNYLVTEVLDEPPEGGITDSTELLTGILDSFGLMQLIAYIEEQYGFSVPNKEVNRRNFATLERLGAFVERKRSGG